MPSALGNFSGQTAVIRDPDNPGMVFPNNQIPASRIRPFARNFLNDFLPRANDGNNFYTFAPAGTAWIRLNGSAGSITTSAKKTRSISVSSITMCRRCNPAPASPRIGYATFLRDSRTTRLGRITFSRPR